ncbi:MAG: hypothetical protein ACXW4G_12140 [Candidatus Deferrimicrobiaceae bacterium]
MAALLDIASPVLTSMPVFHEKKSSKKISFVYRVPGKELMVIAGFFE